MDSPKRTRNRAACKRCQRRKIRVCRFDVMEISVACVNDGKQGDHRSYIASMENRIKWLESIIRDRCPDIDLSRGPESTQETLDNGVQTETLNEARQFQTGVYHQSLQDAVQEERESQAEASPRIVTSQDQEVPQARPQPAVNEESQQAHEIRLASLSPGGDRRYIGPSSGYFFAKRIFKNSAHLSLELLNTPAAIPAQKESTVELTTKYFRTVHLLYPFLHEQTHMEAIDRVHRSQDKSPLETFQVYMVLAIASLNLSRQCKVHLPVEGYYTSAMKHVHYVCNHGSVTSLQCLLLLMVYALYNPSCNIDIWNLNYQCLASVIDLGLQRDVRASLLLRISMFDQEMRTRVVWVVYTFDRIVCTMMGRPIGIRDEACDIRFPLAIPDCDLTKIGSDPQTYDETTSHISYSIHLFRLAQLNSEIRYIMHSINRDVPAYALPVIRDILSWQQEMVRSLDNWVAAIPPQPPGVSAEIVLLCRTKYHEIMILLLRPSPGIPNPSDAILDECFNHALALLREFSDLYAVGNLPYNRLVVHSIFLGTLFNTTQDILSSIGEHWPEATRARDCIKELSTVTIQRLLRMQPAQPLLSTPQPPQYPVDGSHGQVALEAHADVPAAALHGDFLGWSGMSDIDGLMWEIINSAAP
ncbi:putative Zn(II)2Cys6 transcription factor [Aspergillus desertorum]